MLIKYDRFAILPKRCGKCGRKFIWEPYNIYYTDVGIEHYHLKQVCCRECPVDKIPNSIDEDESRKLLNAVKVLRKYCLNHESSCKNCKFYVRPGVCALTYESGINPSYWEFYHLPVKYKREESDGEDKR